MASEQETAVAVATAVVEDVVLQQGGGWAAAAGGGETAGARRNINIAWRKAEEAGESVYFLVKKIAPFKW